MAPTDSTRWTASPARAPHLIGSRRPIRAARPVAEGCAVEASSARRRSLLGLSRRAPSVLACLRGPRASVDRPRTRPLQNAGRRGPQSAQCDGSRMARFRRLVVVATSTTCAATLSSRVAKRRARPRDVNRLIVGPWRLGMMVAGQGPAKSPALLAPREEKERVPPWSRIRTYSSCGATTSASGT